MHTPVNSKTLSQRELIDQAIEKAGGLRELARVIDWNFAALSAARQGTRPIPVGRGAQLVDYIGGDGTKAYLTVLLDHADTRFEKNLLEKLLQLAKSSTAVLTIAAMPVLTSLSMPELIRHSFQAFDSEYTL